MDLHDVAAVRVLERHRLRLTFDDGPHFHARYAGRKATLSIETLQVVAGRLPPRVPGLVVEWGTLHRAELMENWKRARAGRKLRRIAPLE